MTQFVGIQLHMIAGNWDYFPFVSCQDFFLASIPDNIACFCLDVAMACMKTNAYTYNNNEQIGSNWCASDFDEMLAYKRYGDISYCGIKQMPPYLIISV